MTSKQRLVARSRYFAVRVITTRELLPDVEYLSTTSPRYLNSVKVVPLVSSYTAPHDLPREEAFNFACLNHELFEAPKVDIS
jgi:hypothetical protein